MRISAKQDQIGALIAAGKTEILLEGAIGTSKTFGAAIALLSLGLQYPGSRIVVARRNAPELRRTTIMSFREAAFEMSMREGVDYREYRSQGSEHFVLNTTGQDSYIFFIEADPTRGENRLKIDSTCLFVDEADDVPLETYLTLSSRTGRVNKNGAPAFSLLACNPNEGWIKERFYDRFHNPQEYGELPEYMAVLEFEMRDSFLPQSYYQKYSENPEQWRQRYLYNNWNYGDDLYSLFKYRHMDSVHVSTFQRGRRSIAVDAARTGDRTVAALWDNFTLVDIQIIKPKGVEMDYPQQAEIIHDYALNSGVGWQNIDVDGVGEGQGLITAFKTLYDWHVNSFVSNSTPQSKIQLERKLAAANSLEEKQRIKQEFPVVYYDLRSEQTFLLSQDIEQGRVQFYDSCPELKEFKKEATMHNHEENGKVLKVEPKDKVKERTGSSPDIFDAVLMGYARQRRLQSVGTYAQRSLKKPTARTKPITSGLRRKVF